MRQHEILMIKKIKQYKAEKHWIGPSTPTSMLRTPAREGVRQRGSEWEMFELDMGQKGKRTSGETAG
jgi:hypothetical protein